MKQYNTEQYLKELGWDDYFSGAFESMRVPDSLPGRVVSLEKESCQVLTESGELFAGISGKMRFHTDRAAQYPSVGDWVVIQPLDGGTRGLIHAILPRKTKFSRRKPGSRTDEQVVAANVDVVFLVSALDGGRNLNLRRIERYLAIARNSGAAPVIVLNKTDLCDDVAGRIAEVETAAYGIPICAVSAITRTGLDALRGYLSAGMTAVLLGQSGVGKSAIINALLGEERLAIGEVRESDREGRHTTTRRQLILLPGGGAVIDSPGLRQMLARRSGWL